MMLNFLEVFIRGASPFLHLKASITHFLFLAWLTVGRLTP